MPLVLVAMERADDEHDAIRILRPHPVCAHVAPLYGVAELQLPVGVRSTGGHKGDSGERQEK